MTESKPLPTPSPDADGANDAPPMTIRMVLIFYGITLAVAAGWAFFTQPGLALLTTAPNGERAVPWWLASAAVASALIGGTAVAERVWPAMRRLGGELAVAVAPVTPTRIVVFAVASGVAEEALFRGPMQYAFGYVVTSVIFGLLHGGPTRRYYAWSTFALAAGLSFGLLAAAYSSIWPAVLAHVVVNGINLGRLGRHPGPSPA